MIHALVIAVVLQRWLLVSDIHLDPFSNTTTWYGAGDTSPVLWRMTLDAMRRDVPNPTVVVVGGDLMAHHWDRLARDAREDPTAAAIATTREIAKDLGTRYPLAPFLVTLGNNDDPCGDYRSESGGPYQTSIAHIWAPLAGRDRAAPDFFSQFMRGGYYVAGLPGGGHAVVLNSVFWSFANRRGCESDTRGVAAAELRWFTTTLERLPPGARATVLMHIPPGFDPTTTAEAYNLVAVPFLSGSANSALLQAFARNRSSIAFAVAAHTHRYDFRVVSGVPMILGSSVSPVYGNYPAFYELDVDSSGNLHDVIPFVFDPLHVAFEREPGFDAYYGVNTLSGDALTALAERIRADGATRTRWMVAHDAWAHITYHGNPPWTANACAQTELDGGFAACVGTRFGGLRTAIYAFIASIVLVAGVLILAVLVLRRRAPMSR